MKKKRKRILILTSRRSLARTTETRFKEKGIIFENYLNYPNLYDLSNLEYLILEVESLYKYKNNNSREIPIPDLLIIDEISTVQSQFDCKTTMKNKIQENSFIFEELLKKSKKVILSDGFILPLTFEILKSMEINDFIFVHNKYIVERGEALEIPKTEIFFRNVI